MQRAWTRRRSTHSAARLLACLTLGTWGIAGAADGQQTLPPPAAETPTEAAEAAAAAEDPAVTIEAPPDYVARMTARVLVNGQGPFRFVVDTAANRSVVSRELAAQLALPPGPVATLHDIAGVGPVQTAIVGKLAVGGRETEAVIAPVLPRGALGADGILGLDSLADRRIIMDFTNDSMTITPSPTRRAEPRVPGDIVVTARRRHGQLIMTDAEIVGERIEVVVDSGAETSVGNLALLRRITRGRQAAAPMTLIGVTGRTALGQAAIVRRMRLGGLDIVDMTIAFADLHSFRQFGLHRRPALLLGMDVLRAFERVVVDYRRRRISFRMDEESPVVERASRRGGGTRLSVDGAAVPVGR